MACPSTDSSLAAAKERFSFFCRSLPPPYFITALLSPFLDSLESSSYTAPRVRWRDQVWNWKHFNSRGIEHFKKLDVRNIWIMGQECAPSRRHLKRVRIGISVPFWSKELKSRGSGIPQSVIYTRRSLSFKQFGRPSSLYKPIFTQFTSTFVYCLPNPACSTFPHPLNPLFFSWSKKHIDL